MGKQNCWTCGNRTKERKSSYCPVQRREIKGRSELTSGFCSAWAPRVLKEAPMVLPSPSRHPYPPEDSYYLVRHEIDNLVEYAYKNNLAMALEGHTGTGKSEAVRHLAQKYGLPYYSCNLNGQTTTDDLTGKWILRDGSMVWVDGVLVAAIRNGGVFVAEELNAGDPEILFIFHEFDKGYIVLKEKDGEIVSIHPDFRLYATLNPSDHPFYAGTKQLNQALKDRFPIWVYVDYPSIRQEEKLLIEKGVLREHADRIARCAYEIRKAFKNQEIFFPMTIRRTIYWGLVAKDFGLRKSAEITFLESLREDEVTRNAIQVILDAVIRD